MCQQFHKLAWRPSYHRFKILSWPYSCPLRLLHSTAKRVVPLDWQPRLFRGILDGVRVQTLATRASSRSLQRVAIIQTSKISRISASDAKSPVLLRQFHQATTLRLPAPVTALTTASATAPEAVIHDTEHEHAIVSTFDLFSVGIGPSSSHTVGPMRASNLFLADLIEDDLLQQVNKIHVSIYGSLALTGEGHMTPSALLLGLEGARVETVEPSSVPARFKEIKTSKRLFLGRELPRAQTQGKDIHFEYEKDFKWHFGKRLSLHSNGMRFMAFDEEGEVLAMKELFSIGGGFVVPSPSEPSATTGVSARSREQPLDSVTESGARSGKDDSVTELETGKPQHRAVAVYQKGSASAVPDQAATNPVTDDHQRLPRYPFRNANSLLSLCHKHNLTIAQLVYENEKSYGYSQEEILSKIFHIWKIMDKSILEGVQASPDATLPGHLKLHRRAPALFGRLKRGIYSSHLRSEYTQSESFAHSEATSARIWRGDSPLSGSNQVHGSRKHVIPPCPARRTSFPAMDHLNVYAIAVNETNASGGRIVTAPTNGAAGIIPAVLKYLVEFVSDNPARDIPTFLFTASAIGMLFKRGATISAAEGGCMAEVGVACSMAAGAFAACMGASPEVIEQAAEIGIEHNLGLTCDPIGGLVQAPCIERNALGAVKAVSSANLALRDTGLPRVHLDDAIHAMRLTAEGMRSEFKETSLSGLATSVQVRIPVSVPTC